MKVEMEMEMEMEGVRSMHAEFHLHNPPIHPPLHPPFPPIHPPRALSIFFRWLSVLSPCPLYFSISALNSEICPSSFSHSPLSSLTKLNSAKFWSCTCSGARCVRGACAAHAVHIAAHFPLILRRQMKAIDYALLTYLITHVLTYLGVDEGGHQLVDIRDARRRLGRVYAVRIQRTAYTQCTCSVYAVYVHAAHVQRMRRCMAGWTSPGSVRRPPRKTAPAPPTCAHSPWQRPSCP